MPVIFDEGSKALTTWLDPGQSKWSADLQFLLKPYQGELDIYQVSKDVGKVGNNSPTFILPIDSSENKNNIANFFGNGKSNSNRGLTIKKEETKNEEDNKEQHEIKHESPDNRATVDHDGSEDNAPLPVPSPVKSYTSVKREHESTESDAQTVSPPKKSQKTADGPVKNKESPAKLTSPAARKTRSATSNAMGKSPRKANSKAEDGSQKITQFFGK
jgi:hypothetical protein